MSDPIQAKTAEAIRDDMLNELASQQGITDDEIGANDRTFCYAAAQEIDEGYFQLLRAERGSYINTSTGQALKNRMADYGLSKRLATKSVTTLRFTTTGAATLNAGDVFSKPATVSEDQIDFVLTETKSIGGAGTLDVGAQAVLAGSHASQLAVGVINQLTTTVSNVSAVLNPATTSVSLDDESDESAHQRLQAHIIALSRGTVDAILSGAINFAQQKTRLLRKLPSGQTYLETEDVGEQPFSAVGTGKLAIRDTIGGPISEVVSYSDIDETLDPDRFTSLTRAVVGSDIDHEIGAVVEEYIPESAGKWPSSASLVEGTASVTVYIDDVTQSTGADAELVSLVQKRLRGDPDNWTRDPGYRAGGINLIVTNRTTVSITYVLDVQVATGYNSNSVRDAIKSAIEANNNVLPIDHDVYPDQVLCWAHDVPGCERVVSLTINGTAYDGATAGTVSIAATQVARTVAANITVNV